MKKHPIMSGMVALSLVLGFTALALPAHADFNLDGLNQQVQNQGKEIDNHEGRIKTLEDKTGTPTPPPDSGDSTPALHTSASAPLADPTPTDADTTAPVADQPTTPAPTADPAPDFSGFPPGVNGFTPKGHF